MKFSNSWRGHEIWSSGSRQLDTVFLLSDVSSDTNGCPVSGISCENTRCSKINRLPKWTPTSRYGWAAHVAPRFSNTGLRTMWFFEKTSLVLRHSHCIEGTMNHRQKKCKRRTITAWLGTTALQKWSQETQRDQCWRGVDKFIRNARVVRRTKKNGTKTVVKRRATAYFIPQ